MGDFASGLLLTCTIGLLWSFTGVYYKLMAKWKLNPYDVGILTGIIGIVVNLLFVTKTGKFFSGEIPLPSWHYGVFVLFAGFANGWGSYVLQRSMLYGKSGVTWAIGQCALIVPFFAITIIYSEPWNLLKLSGTAVIAAGMIAVALRNSQKSSAEAPDPRYGVVLALAAFVILGGAQSMTSATSFMSYTDQGLLRPLITGAGAVLAAAACKIYLKEKKFYFPKKLIPVITLLSLQAVLVQVMQFCALDRLKNCGMNGVFFPIAVGLCIAGYSVWSLLFFKEKCSGLFIGSVAAILFGIGCFCIADI